jgi:geranylgeranyl reductase family protein
MATRDADVIVVGGGPGGSTLAWDLARRGVDVLLLERTRFPREKVCGDYVEPRGLRILQHMGALAPLRRRKPLPITDSATWVDWTCRYQGPIPFYDGGRGLPPHGYIVPRDVLDDVMLRAAEKAGARVQEETQVTDVETRRDGVVVTAGRGDKTVRFRAPLVAGADGANSVVGKPHGLPVDDPRHVAVAQRAYATVDEEAGEAVFCFDRSLFPGYGWMFPMAGGRVNVGVGILSEARQRLGVHVPDLFMEFVEGLRRHHPRCARLELEGPPIGGIVRTYGAAGTNRFDRGVLVGDAGSFVDPMTGEGITPAMESALLAAPVLAEALERGRYSAAALAPYETAFRAYFDPAMQFLDLCAATLRNPFMASPWLKALARGCELAQEDEGFARLGGGYFGGLDVQPFGILGAMWVRVIQDVAGAWPRLLTGGGGTTVADLVGWQAAWSRSFVADPLWHTRWTLDVQRKWLRLLAVVPGEADPRLAGISS